MVFLKVIKLSFAGFEKCLTISSDNFKNLATVSIADEGKPFILFYYFFSPKPSWSLNENNPHDKFAFEGKKKKCIIQLLKENTALASLSSGKQHLKGPRDAFVQKDAAIAMNNGL